MDMIKAQKGFTLIEVMIAVVILGILLSIAVPAYSKFVTKARRGDATAMLVDVAGEQQRFRSEQNRYATSMAELGYDNDPMPSKDGFYRVSIASPSPTTYVLTASPAAGKAQEFDAECGAFTLRSNGVKGSAGGIDCW